MKKYKSKIGFGLVLFLVLILGSTSILMIYAHAWPGLLINLAVAAFIAYLFRTTYYIINGNELFVICGFMFNKAINVEGIKKIAETNNILSAPAASLDRLVIYYNNYDSIMISPKDKMEFIEHLTAKNPAIEVEMKKKKK